MGWKWKQEIRLQYDTEADGYDELYSQEQNEKYDLAIDHINPFSATERILDSGCGTGIFLDRVASNVEYAVGIDFSSKALQKARVRLNRLTNVYLVCADFDYLPFALSTFTHIFMFTALPAPAHWDVGLAQALRALTDTGTVVLSVPKAEISNEMLLAKLKGNKLEPRALIDQENTPDYVFIGERAHRLGG